jgi:hypothetical protein
MRSKTENNRWFEQISWAFDHAAIPEALAPDVPWSIARSIWEHENAKIEDLHQRMLGVVSDRGKLREYLEFDEVDESLWRNYACFVHSLLERDDVTNLDVVFGELREFVTTCSRFNDLRFSKRFNAASKEAKEPRVEKGSKT